MEKVRVRFAPSPTGPLHMGGVRTALYNYLFAKSNGGDFLLRIEDTDQTRYVPGAEDYIVESLKWCGINIDEGPQNPGEFGPYKQSERKPMYRQYADMLVEKGHAYYAFDTAEDLENMRNRLKAAGVPSPQYNAVTRETMQNSISLSEDEVSKRLANGDPYVIRVKIPRNEEVRFNDIIRGWVVVQTSNLDDKVIFKSDGMPTYHLANIVDDHLMKITHVIRGEEWLPSAPLHVLLYKFFGWNQPQFAHLPLILKPDGNGKLSKRDGDRLGFPVFPLEWKDPASGNISSGYREKGYFAEAFLNMLALLGWNPGTEKEIFSLDELIESFTLERVGKSGAKFDADKSKWLNQQWLRNTSSKTLAESLRQEVNSDVSIEFLTAMIDLTKERSTFTSDLLADKYFFESPQTFDEKTVRKKWKAETPDRMLKLQELVLALDVFDSHNIETCIKQFLEDNELGFGQVLPNLRLIITGQGMGPSLFHIMELLGKNEVEKRLKTNIEAIENLK